LWQALLIGPFLIAAGLWEYTRLADLEDQGGVIYVDKFTAFLYRIGGKQTVLVITAGFGVFYIYLLWHWWRTTRAAERRLAEMDAALEPTAAEPAKPKRERGEPAPYTRARAEAVPADPFRAAPTTPVQVIRTERAAPKPVVVKTDGEARGPSILK